MTNQKYSEIIEFIQDDRICDFFVKNWGNDFIVSNGEILYGADLPGFMVLDGDKIIGLLTYHVSNNSCEIVSINSLVPNIGIGTKLLNKMIEKAKQDKYSRLWLMTSNDNIDAMRFYQTNGFVFAAIYPNAIEKSRQLGQRIPKLGSYNIPVRDEIEFEYPL
ncbi:MAG: GNAT family N-acetyltransferase [Candidatus Saccharibacteria bacterium]